MEETNILSLEDLKSALKEEKYEYQYHRKRMLHAKLRIEKIEEIMLKNYGAPDKKE